MLWWFHHSPDPALLWWASRNPSSGPHSLTQSLRPSNNFDKFTPMDKANASTEILHALAPIFMSAPIFDYKIKPVSDHVAEFFGDRPRDRGERVAKEKTSAVKHTPLRYYGSERPSKIEMITMTTHISLTSSSLSVGREAGREDSLMTRWRPGYSCCNRRCF